MTTIAGINYGNLPVEDVRSLIRISSTVPKSYRNVEAIDSVAIHQSLTTTGDAFSFANYHVLTKKWSCMGYTYVIKTNGVIQIAADLNVRTPHVGNHNSRSLGICIVGDLRYSQPTAAQYKSLYGLIAVLIAYKGLPKITSAINFWGHQEYSGYNWKQCPALDMDSLRGHIAAKTYGAVKHNFNNDTKRLIVLPADSKPRETIEEPVKQVEQPKAAAPKARTILKEGYTGADVRQLQSDLVKAGFKIAVDGIYGPATKAAVTTLQGRTNLKKDGIYGPNTHNVLQAILKNPAKTAAKKHNIPSGTYKPSSTYKSGVRDLQEVLKDHKPQFDPGKIDGIYGPATKDAVLRYQKYYGVKPYDGIYGNKTEASLRKTYK